MDLGLNQPLKEISKDKGKDGRCVGLTTLPPSCVDCLEVWEPQPPGNLRACSGLKWESFTFTSLPLRLRMQEGQ
jgi:hypothetical protein